MGQWGGRPGQAGMGTPKLPPQRGKVRMSRWLAGTGKAGSRHGQAWNPVPLCLPPPPTMLHTGRHSRQGKNQTLILHTGGCIWGSTRQVFPALQHPRQVIKPVSCNQGTRRHRWGGVGGRKAVAPTHRWVGWWHGHRRQWQVGHGRQSQPHMAGTWWGIKNIAMPPGVWPPTLLP